MIANSFEIRKHLRIKNTGFCQAGSVLHPYDLILTVLGVDIIDLLFIFGHLFQNMEGGDRLLGGKLIQRSQTYCFRKAFLHILRYS